MNKPMTELDKKLQEMAIMNWPQFVQMVGLDAITAAKVCLLRKNDKSYGEISNKLGITEHQARYSCQKCEKD
jgi:predicted transcriptional regulator